MGLLQFWQNKRATGIIIQVMGVCQEKTWNDWKIIKRWWVRKGSELDRGVEMEIEWGFVLGTGVQILRWVETILGWVVFGNLGWLLLSSLVVCVLLRIFSSPCDLSLDLTFTSGQSTTSNTVLLDLDMFLFAMYSVFRTFDVNWWPAFWYTCTYCSKRPDVMYVFVIEFHYYVYNI